MPIRIARDLVITIVFLMMANGAGAVPVEEWKRTFGGSYWDEANSIMQTPDNGYIISGSTYYNERWDSYDAWLIKTNAEGHEQWNRTYTGIRIKNITSTPDGGYILRGLSGQDLWLMRTDASGREQWNSTISIRIKDNFTIFSIDGTSDGGSIIAGCYFKLLELSRIAFDTRLTKVDADGNEKWNVTSKRLMDFVASSVKQTKDGGYIIAGTAMSGNSDALIIKMDENGNQEWERKFGWDPGVEEAYSIEQTRDGGYIIAGGKAGFQMSFANDYNAWLIKIDPDGNEQWNRVFGESGEDFFTATQQTSNGGYISTGYTNINMADGIHGLHGWVIKTDANGNQQWRMVLGGEKMYEPRSIIENPDQSYVLAGHTESNGAGDRDAWIAKIRETKDTTSGTAAEDIDDPDKKSTSGFEISGAMLSMVLLLSLLKKRI